MLYIGIDPGQKGGIAVIEAQEGVRKAPRVFPYTDGALKGVCAVCAKETALCVVEKVGAMPKQGVTSTFNFGKSFGYILGVLEANNIPYELVTPKKWKKHFSLDDDKKKSIQTAKRLFPGVSLLPTARCRVESDGMAEALLLALYAYRLETNNGLGARDL